MSQKPTIVFVPGAWFKATAYADFLKALQDAGFPVSASDYPSLDPPAEEAVKTDCKADTDHLREKVLVPLVNHEEKDVVVVMHSYGGMPGSGAAHGLSKSSREKAGKKGGVVGLIMISGFIVAQDVSCAGSMQGDTPPWVLKDKPKPGLCTPGTPMHTLTEDVPPDVAKKNLDQMVPHATVAFFSPQTPPAFTEPGLKDKLGFILLLKDQAIPKAGQEAMMEYSGQKWQVKELDTSHNGPFTSKIRETVELIEVMIKSFT